MSPLLSNANSSTSTGALVALVLGAAACGPDATDIKVRAAFDLKCPKEQLEVIKLGERSRGVRGCGNQATYVYQGGEWLLNTDTQSKPTASTQK